MFSISFQCLAFITEKQGIIKCITAFPGNVLLGCTDPAWGGAEQGWAVPAEFSTPGQSMPVAECPSSYLSKFLREKEHAETRRTGSTESHSKLLLVVLFLGFPSNETKGFSCFQTAFENIFSHFISLSSPEKLSKTVNETKALWHPRWIRRYLTAQNLLGRSQATFSEKEVFLLFAWYLNPLLPFVFYIPEEHNSKH